MINNGLQQQIIKGANKNWTSILKNEVFKKFEQNVKKDFENEIQFASLSAFLILFCKI